MPDATSVCRYRFSPCLELVQLERLSPEQIEQLGGQEAAEEIFGLVRPREGDGAGWGVGREAALLLLAVRTPGPLPGFAYSSPARKELTPEVCKLIADGVLEMEINGSFRAGPQALQACGNPAARLAGRGYLWDLSLQALKHAAALVEIAPQQVGSRLYQYPRLPMSQRRLKKLPRGREEVLPFVGLGPETDSRRRLDRLWRFQGTGDEHWFSWSSRKRCGAGRGHCFKLYVSPEPEALAACLEVLARELPGLEAEAFKVAARPGALLRPDKLVVYFSSFEKLAMAGQRLAGRLTSVPVHGVPFTAPVSSDGLLSWGVDPAVALPSSTRSRASWRSWLVGRLAHFLILASTAPNLDLSPVSFALRRVELEAVDVCTWAPSPSFWARQSPTF